MREQEISRQTGNYRLVAHNPFYNDVFVHLNRSHKDGIRTPLKDVSNQ